MRNTFLLRLQHSQRRFHAAAARCRVAHHQFHLPVAIEAVVVDDLHRLQSFSAPLGFDRDSEFSFSSLLRSVSCVSRGFAAMAESVPPPPRRPEQGLSSSSEAEVSGIVGVDLREMARSPAGAPEDSAAVAEAGEEVAAAPRRYAILTTGKLLECADPICNVLESVASNMVGRESRRKL